MERDQSLLVKIRFFREFFDSAHRTCTLVHGTRLARDHQVGGATRAENALIRDKMHSVENQFFAMVPLRQFQWPQVSKKTWW